jgi:pre-rRNA-processing protein RIX1
VKPSSEPHRKLKQEVPLLETVLHAFNDLIARHPTIFRPFSSQIHSLLVSIIGSSTSFRPLPERVVELSQKLFISLHNCAPKNTSSEEWANACKLTIASIHRTADHAFRSLVEQWESTDPNFRNSTISRDSSQQVGDDGPDALGLSGWEGIPAGAGRLTTLLRLLSGFMSTRTASAVNIPIGAVLDLTSRLTSVTIPREGDDDNVQANREISREEREDLWVELPRIHVACIELFSNIIASLETAAISVVQNILEQTIWLFEAERSHRGIRAASYQLINRLLPLVGPSLTKSNLSALSTVIRFCCRDLLPSDSGSVSQSHNQTQPKNKPKGNQGSANADAFLNPALKGGNQSGAVAFVGLQSTAAKLLPILLASLPLKYIPLPLRIELDRTAILIGDQDAMMASVLNPVPVVKGRRVTPSILPFLVRRYSKELEVECLLRPRMPVLLGASEITDPILDEEEDEAENSEQAKTVVASHIFESSVPLSLNQAPSRADVTQNAVRSPGKRILPQDTHPSGHHTLTKSNEENHETPQTKKARLQPDDTVPSAGSQASSSPDSTPRMSISGQQVVPVTLSETALSPATVPLTSAPSVPSVSNASVSVLESVGGRMQSTDVRRDGEAGAQDEGEESDDEIPALNIEPDTDEEDEEDTLMEG